MAHALDLVGERWALLVVRELMLGPKRFSDLRTALPGISANVLTQRLDGLEAAGVLLRHKLPPPASVQVYQLTAWGYELEPIFQTLGRWAARSPGHDPSLPLSAVSLFLSFRTMFDPAKANGASASIGFQFGEESFLARVRNGELEAGRGDLRDAATIVTGGPRAVAAVVYGGQSLSAMEAADALGVAGDRAAFERFVTWFPLPAPV